MALLWICLWNFYACIYRLGLLSSWPVKLLALQWAVVDGKMYNWSEYWEWGSVYSLQFYVPKVFLEHLITMFSIKEHHTFHNITQDAHLWSKLPLDKLAATQACIPPPFLVLLLGFHSVSIFIFLIGDAMMKLNLWCEDMFINPCKCLEEGSA